MSERKTVRVRIAVAVDPSGDWSACGWAGSEDDDKRGIASDTVGEHEAIYWLEADLPIPEQRRIEPTITVEARDD